MKDKKNSILKLAFSNNSTFKVKPLSLYQNAILLEILDWMNLKQAKNELGNIGLKFDFSDPFTIVYISLDDVMEFRNSHEQFQMLTRTEEICSRVFGISSDFIHASTPDKDCIFLLRMKTGSNLLKDNLECIQEYVLRHYKTSISIVYDNQVAYNELHKRIQEIKSIQRQLRIENQRMALLDRSFYSLSNSSVADDVSNCSFFSIDEKLVNSIATGKTEELITMIRVAFGADRSVVEKLEFYHSIMASILEYVRRSHVDDTILKDDSFFDLFCRYPEPINLSTTLENLIERLVSIRKEHWNSYASHIIQDIDNFIIGHLNKALSLTMIADAFSLNPTYLSRLYKTKTGKNISDLILEQRLQKARKMLLNPSLRIGDIAFESGFGSSSYFSRVFRKVENCSPKEWRKSHMKEMKREVDNLPFN